MTKEQRQSIIYGAKIHLPNLAGVLIEWLELREKFYTGPDNPLSVSKYIQLSNELVALQKAHPDLRPKGWPKCDLLGEPRFMDKLRNLAESEERTLKGR